MKVLVYCDTVFGYGSVERVLSVIAQAMAKNNDVKILSTNLREIGQPKFDQNKK